MMILFLSFFIQFAIADDFSKQAPVVAGELKKNLLGNLQKQIKENGTKKAIEFCQLNVKGIGQDVSKKFSGAYEFGRTSHKLRNSNNTPQDWIGPYIAKFKDKKQGDPEAKSFILTLADGKKAYLEPLWVIPLCLQCHGDNLAKDVQGEISTRYPKDQATGFKVGDFRGFLWVKEK